MTGCVFCGASPTSREHILPSWLREGPGKVNSVPYQKTVIVDPDDTILRAARHKFGEMVVKCVCEPCNNGWMQEMAGNVKEFLLALIIGGDIGVRLDRKMQSDLAAWSFKTILMCSFLNPKEYHGVIPAADFRFLYRHRRLSTRRMIARTFHMPIPSYDTSEIVAIESSVRKTVSPRGISGFLRIGHFGIQVCSVRLPGDRRLDPFAEFPNATPLWPPTEMWEWPPEEKCTEQEIRGVQFGGIHSPLSTSKRQ
jgi:hypothetical protein